MQWVSLLTDWGLRDHYVAQLKAALGMQMPEARIIDVCHEVPRADVYTAAYMLADFIPRCPQGTIHIVGVSDIASIQTPNMLVNIRDQYVIAVDNGFFSLLLFLLNESPKEVTEIDLCQDTSVLSFPARDLFVKVASIVASGEPLSKIGYPGNLRNLMMQGGFMKVISEKDKEGNETGRKISGKILFVDGFGNVVTDITREKVEECIRTYPAYALMIRGKNIKGARFEASYSPTREGDVAMVFLDNDLLEVSVNMGNFQRMFGVERNDELQIVFRPEPVPKLKI